MPGTYPHSLAKVSKLAPITGKMPRLANLLTWLLWYPAVVVSHQQGFPSMTCTTACHILFTSACWKTLTPLGIYHSNFLFVQAFAKFLFNYLKSRKTKRKKKKKTRAAVHGLTHHRSRGGRGRHSLPGSALARSLNPPAQPLGRGCL